MVDVRKSYDTHAHDWAKRIQEGGNPAHSLLEKPAMEALIPDLAGCRVLAIGCGSAEELGMLLAAGAVENDIVGIDVSSELLDIARQRYPQALFEVRSMQDLGGYHDNSFDFVYSSLTLHYALDWIPILTHINRILKPGSHMLFSTHHPIKWGSQVARGEALDVFSMGYERPKVGSPIVHGDYLGSREIKDVWFGNQEVSYYHRPLGAIIGDILESGLNIRAFVEPAPVPEASEINPGFFAIHSKIPIFMIFDLEKRRSNPE